MYFYKNIIIFDENELMLHEIKIIFCENFLSESQIYKIILILKFQYYYYINCYYLFYKQICDIFHFFIIILNL